MKILTKKWAKKNDLLRLIHSLKEYNANSKRYKDIKIKSKKDYLTEMKSDEDLFKVAQQLKIVDKLYKAEVRKNKITISSLPKDVYSKINNLKALALGYVSTEDKNLLNDYAKKLLVEIEEKVNMANNITEISEDYLQEEFVLDNFVGELVYEEYVDGSNYFIKIGDYNICIENFEIIKRENFEINKWEENNPISLWTALYSAELHFILPNYFELHLLLVDGDKYANQKYWYFTLKGTNVKKV